MTRVPAADTVVVTGTAMLSAAGSGPEPVITAIRAGRTFLRPPEPAPLPPRLVEWPQGRFWADAAKYVNESGRTAVSVARSAWAMGSGTPGDPRQGGVVVGLSSAGSDELGSDQTAGIYPQLAARFAQDARPLPTLLYDEVPDFAYLRGLPSMAGQFVARACGFSGSNLAVNGEGAAGGLGALALAVRLVTSGELDRVMVVAVAPARTRSALAAADRAEPLARQAGDRGDGADLPTDGEVPAEGAAAVLLESAPAARSRGAVPLARVVGCETICAADRRTALETAIALVSPRDGCLPAVAAPTSRPAIGTAFECAGLIDVVLAVEVLHRGRGSAQAQAPFLVTATDHGPASGGAGAALIDELIDEVGR